MSTVHHNVAGTANAETAPAVIAARDAEFAAEIQRFAATADALGAPRPASDELTTIVEQVARFVHDLFPGKLAVETRVDPEIGDDIWLLFRVDACGTVEEILSLEDAWLRRVVSLAPRWPGLFRLSIDAR